MNEDTSSDKVTQLRDALRAVGREIRNSKSKSLDFDLYKEHVVEVLRLIADVFCQERMLLEVQGDFKIIGKLL
ncbi:hypothetical protein EON65_56250 [archaeon]|nr:MAG: hypothetical protein EON65_56250 [archaeon]